MSEVDIDKLSESFDDPSGIRELTEIEASYKLDLNERQENFINEYFINGGDGPLAAIRAGYSVWKSTDISHSLLKHPKIKSEIERRREIMRKKYEISHDHVLKEYAKMSFANIKDYFEVDENGNIKPLDINKITDYAAAAIESVEIDPVTNKIVKFKMTNKQNALSALSKNLGVFENSDKMILEMGLAKFLKLLPEADRDRLKTAMLNKIEDKLISGR